MKRTRGYIFLEVLVASAILALIVGAMLTAVVGSVRGVRATADARLALLIARSQLAAVGATTPLTPGGSSGIDAGLVWRVDIEPYPATAGPALRRVVVRVAAPDGRELARLATLRRAP